VHDRFLRCDPTAEALLLFEDTDIARRRVILCASLKPPGWSDCLTPLARQLRSSPALLREWRRWGWINRHTPQGVVRLARGCNPGGGGADLIYFERGDGGRVLAAGSITFAGALAHDPVVDRSRAPRGKFETRRKVD
jgi:hypothetical protein